MSQATPQPQATRPAKQPGKRSCLLTVLILLVGVILGGLVAGKVVGQRLITEQLAKEIGPAQPWSASLGLFDAPKLLLGMPGNVTVTGDNIQVKGGSQIKHLQVDGVGLRVDRAAKKLSGAERIGVKAQLAEPTVVQFIRDEAISSRAFQDVKVAFGVGELLLDGTISAPLLRNFTQYNELQASAKAKPEIAPPSSVRLRVSDVTLSSGGQRISIPTMAVSGLLAQDLRFDLSRLVPGITLQTVEVVDGALAISGTLDPRALSGNLPAPSGTPLLPDPPAAPPVES